MRIFLRILIALLLMTSVCFAGNLYVVLDGTTPKGTISASGRILKDWRKDFTLISVGEEFRGKSHYEIKYSGGKVRLATQQEIDTYKQQLKATQEATKKQNALDILGLTKQHLNKIKAL